MLNQFINIIFMTLAGTAQGIALEYMLDTNNIRTKKSFRIVYWTILAFMPSVLNVMVDSGNSTIILRNIIHWGMAIIAIICFYLGPVWRRLLAVVLVYFGMTTADLVLLLVMHIFKIDWMVFWDKGSTISVVFVGIGMSISIVVIAIIAYVWRKLFYKGEKVKYFGFFMIYMLGYVVSIAYSQLQIWNYQLSVKALWPILTSMICEIALLSIIFSQSEKDAIEMKLIEGKQRERLEEIHYKEIIRRRKEMLKISMNNRIFIDNIFKFLKQGMMQDAENELNIILHQIQSTKEYPYCEIPVINALLSEKQKVCNDYKIVLQTEIHLSEKVDIQMMDLCSVFGNLTDNAIRACRKIKKEIKNNDEIVICIIAEIRNNYLIIKCENPTLTEPGLKPEGTGYGLKILRGIAEKYHGDFQTTYENHKYTSLVSLRL